MSSMIRYHSRQSVDINQLALENIHMERDWPMRCDVCGRFVGMNGYRRMITPDSDYSREDYETLCPRHMPQHAESIGTSLIDPP